MSVPATGGVPTGGAGEEAIELPRSGDAAFGQLMDALAPEADGGEAAPAAGGGAPAADAPVAGGADPDGGGDGAAQRPTAGDAPADDGAGGAGAGTGAADTGAAGGDPADAAAGAGAGDQGGAGALDAAVLVPKLGELSTKFEEATTQAYRQAAYDEVREEHGQYFTALEQHPRLLVGREVPAIGKEGMETLNSTEDAKDWQDAVKSLLVQEINDRASRQLDESKDFMATVHASIDLFKNNADLIPNTKSFDRELADQFAEFAKPYELRVDGKLQGYSVPVQPMIDQLRTRLAAQRAAAPASAAPAGDSAKGSPPAAGAAAAPAAQPASADAPQAGIPSKAGNSGNKEDFSTLFGTIGLPNLQI